MANLCSTLQALHKNILSDSDSESETQNCSGLSTLPHHTQRRSVSSSSDGSFVHSVKLNSRLKQQKISSTSDTSLTSDSRTRERVNEGSSKRDPTDESRRNSFDEVFVPLTSKCGRQCFSGPVYIRCRCCGRLKKPGAKSQNEVLQSGTAQSKSCRNGSSVQTADSIEDDKPPPVPERRPIIKTKPDTFQPTQINKNDFLRYKPEKHITFSDVINNNATTDAGRKTTDFSIENRLSAWAERTRTTYYNSLNVSPAETDARKLPRYEDLIGARTFGFQTEAKGNSLNDYREESRDSPVLPSLKWESLSPDPPDTFDREKIVVTESSSALNEHSKKTVVEYLV